MPPVERFALMSRCSSPVPMKSSAGTIHVFAPLKVNGTVVKTAVSALAGEVGASATQANIDAAKAKILAREAMRDRLVIHPSRLPKRYWLHARCQGRCTASPRARRCRPHD